MSKPSRIFALVEDRLQQQFLYRFLLLSGIRSDEIEIDLSPSAHGAAEHWVRKNFPRFVKKCRARNARNTSTGMIVMLDADSESVRRHIEELDEALTDQDLEKIDPRNDPIARLIPKWSVETWILFLSAKGTNEPPVSEETPYKNSKTPEQWRELVPSAVLNLRNLTTAPTDRPVRLLESIRFAIDEIPRAIPAAG
jgi:hypothetical protein